MQFFDRCSEKIVPNRQYIFFQVYLAFLWLTAHWVVAAVVAYWCGSAGQQVDVDYHTVLEDTLFVVGLEVDTEHHAECAVVSYLEVSENHALVECTLVVAGLEVAV